MHLSTIRIALLALFVVAAGAAMDQEELRERYGKMAKRFDVTSVPEDYTIEAVFYTETHKKGRIKTIVPLNPEGEKDGLELEKVAFGWTVTGVTPYVDGVRHGVEREFHYNKVPGTRKKERIDVVETPWVEGVIHGTRIMRHTNGEIQNEIPFHHGKQHGTSKTYDKQGRLEREVIYVEGQREGPMVEYYPESGQVKRRLPYVEDQVHGVVEEFYSNGQLKRRIELVDGEYHGIYEEYAGDGTLRSRAYFLNDEEVDKAAYEAASKE